VLNAFLKSLPLTEDFEEDEAVDTCLLSLLTSSFEVTQTLSL
jgi:hypothetical protein